MGLVGLVEVVELDLAVLVADKVQQVHLESLAHLAQELLAELVETMLLEIPLQLGL